MSDQAPGEDIDRYLNALRNVREPLFMPDDSEGWDDPSDDVLAGAHTDPQGDHEVR